MWGKWGDAEGVQIILSVIWRNRQSKHRTSAPNFYFSQRAGTFLFSFGRDGRRVAERERGLLAYEEHQIILVVAAVAGSHKHRSLAVLQNGGEAFSCLRRDCIGRGLGAACLASTVSETAAEDGSRRTARAISHETKAQPARWSGCGCAVLFAFEHAWPGHPRSPKTSLTMPFSVPFAPPWLSRLSPP